MSASMDALEALKNEGNALFQQQRFVEAVQAYSSVISNLHDAGVNDEATARLEMAVRLNRAWAWIQMPNGDSNGFALSAAEKDCSIVIEKDPSCVKAYYRRALARECRGQWKMAMDDAVTMKHLEPDNPSVTPLLERLQQHVQEEEDHLLPPVHVASEDLAPNFQQCLIACSTDDNATASSTNALAEEAENAWRALQEVEGNLRKVYISTSKRPAAVRSKPTRSQKNKSASHNGNMKGEISQKTEDIWESLRREEITTVAKAFPRSRKDRSVVR